MPGGSHWSSIIKAEARTFNAGKIFTPKDHLHLSLPHQKAWPLLAHATLKPCILSYALFPSLTSILGSLKMRVVGISIWQASLSLWYESF
jgi:hypothetical protein